MPQNTQRPRYFDGEFLRSGDFTDEQSYHIGMRRLLNQEFDRSGIVRGLEIVQDQNSVPSPPPALSIQSATSPSSQSLALPLSFYSVTPGFAIDQIGREISVSAPYSLTPLLSRAGVTNAWYELWIVYTETMSGSPAPGYQLCNQLSQNTRWDESFDLVLRPLGVAPDPNVPDPNHDLKGLCLAVLRVVSSSISGLQFFVPSDYYRRRRYARIRAQSIIAPDDVTSDYVTLAGLNNYPPPPEGYIHIRTKNGVYSEGNLIVRKNLLVGDDFLLQNADGSTPNPTNLTGNLKLYSDIFLNGQIYTNPSGTWVTLSSYVKDLINGLLKSVAADVQVIPPTPISIGGTTGNFSPSSALPPMTTALPSFSSVDVQAYVLGMTFCDQTMLANWNAAAANQSGLLVTASATPTVGSSGTPVTITINCSVPVTVNPNSVFQSVNVAGIVIFRP